MRFTTIALIAFIAISYANAAGIKDNQTYIDCENSIGSIKCKDATTSKESCDASRQAFAFCVVQGDNKTNCSIDDTPDLSTFVSCINSCTYKITDSFMKDHIEKYLDCLNGSLLSSVASILIGVVALLF